MNSKAAILGCFVGSVAIITYRDIGNGDQWPLPAPPPFRYVGAGVAFVLLALLADTINDRIAAALAFGLLIGLGFQTAQNPPKSLGARIGETTGSILGGGVVHEANKPPKSGSEGTGNPLRRP